MDPFEQWQQQGVPQAQASPAGWLRDQLVGPAPTSSLQGPAILGPQSLRDLMTTAPQHALDPRANLRYGPSGEVWDMRMGDPPADRQWLSQPWARKPGDNRVQHVFQRGQFPLQTVNGVVAAQG